MRKCIVISYLFLLLLNFNCKKQEKSSPFKSIVVTDNGDKFYLTDGIGKVVKNHEYKDYKFMIPHRALNLIEYYYVNNDLKELPNDYIIKSSNKDSIYPTQRFTTISFYFLDGAKKQISFYDDGYKNPLDRFPEEDIKPIFQESFILLKKIRDSTGERSESLR